MIEEKTWQVAVLVGSLETHGYSARLASALARLAPERLRLEMVAIDGLPFYKTEYDFNPTPSIVAFRRAIDAADAVLIVTPEYNRSVPAVLKNALDVGSRPPGQGAFRGKPAAIASQSIGPIGGFGASQAVRQVLVALGMPTLGRPEVYLGNAPLALGVDGELLEDGVRDYLQGFIAAFANWIARFANA